MMPIHHPVLTPSPLQNAFPHIPWMYGDAHESFPQQYTDDHHPSHHSGGGMWLSKPELLLLQSAEENPLEYTLAEYDDSFLYVRVLLKLLDQVTSIQHQASYSHTGNQHLDAGLSVSASSWGRVDCGIQEPLSKEDALEVYSHDKMGVVTHYVITKLYELMGLLIERQQHDQQRRSPNQKTAVSILNLFYHRANNHETFTYNNDDNDNKHTLIDDWRPLMRLLYRSESDDFSKRGAALVLAYIFMAGCEAQQQQEAFRKTLLLAPLSDSTNHDNSNDVLAETLQSLISWLTSRLQASHNTSLGIVTPTLMVLATLPQARRAFDQAGGIGYLSRHIRIFHYNHQRHKHRMNRIRKDHQPSQRPISSQNRYSNSPIHQNGDRKDGSSMLLESVSSVLSTALSPSPRHSRGSSIVSPTSTLRSLSHDNPSLGLQQQSEHGDTVTYLAEVASSLASQVAEVLPSPSSLMTQENTPRRSPPTTPNGNNHHKSIINGLSSTSHHGAQTPLSISSSSSPSSSVQQLYEFVFTLWCMGLDCPERNAVRQHFARDGAVPALVQLLQTAPREKILRLAVATLRQLATLDDGGKDSAGKANFVLSDNGDSAKITSTIFVREMVACDIHKPLDLLQQREWNDPDLQDDINVLCEAVQAHTRELTQWKVYQAEVESGVLRWSSRLHCSKFFRENARSMEGPRGDFEPLQRLVQILYRHTQNGRLSSVSGSKTMYVGLKEVVVPGKNGSRYDNKEFSWDQDDINDDEVCETLAVALYDIGEFARHYPNGRGVIAAAGRLQWAQTDPRQESVLGKTKSLVFQYMHHPREEVQEQALSCISKLLVKNWNVS